MSEALRSVKVSLSMDTTEYINGTQQAKTVTRSFRRDVNLTQAEMAKLTDEYKQQGVTLKFQIDESKRFTNQLKSQINDFKNTSNELNKVSQHYLKLTGAIGKTGDELEEYNAIQQLGASASQELKDQVSDIVQKYQELRAANDLLVQEEQKQQAETKKTTDAIANLEAQYKRQSDTLGLTTRELEQYNAAQQLGSNATQEQIDRVRELVTASQNLAAEQQATKFTTDLQNTFTTENDTRHLDRNQIEEYNAVKSLGTYATEEQIQQVKQLVIAQQTLRQEYEETSRVKQQNEALQAQAISSLSSLESTYRQQAETISLTKNELEQYNAVKSLGAGATDEQIEQVKRLVIVQQNLREEYQSTQVISELEQEYRKQSLAVQLTSNELEEYTAVQRLGINATETQINEVKQLVQVQQQLRTSQQQAQAVERQQQQAIHQTTTTIEQMQLEIKQLTDTRNLDSRSIAQYNAVQKLGSNATQAQIQQTERLAAELYELRGAQNQASGGFSEIRGIAQSAGFQLQDTIVQAQMGTDAFVILAQQGSQFAGAFGATGALIGAGIAIVAASMPALIKMFNEASVSTKELEEAQKRLDEVFSDVSDTSADYAESMQKLYEQDSRLAKLKLSTALNDAQSSLKAFSVNLEDALGKSVISAANSANAYKNLAAGMVQARVHGMDMSVAANQINNNLKENAKDLGISETQLVALSKAYSEFKTTGNTDALIQAFDDIRDSAGNVPPKLNAVVNEFIEVDSQIKKTKIQIEQLETTLSSDKGLTGSLEETIQKWKEKTLAIGKTEEALALFEAATDEGVKAGTTEYAMLQNTISGYFAARNAADAYRSAVDEVAKGVSKLDPKWAALQAHQQRLTAYKNMLGQTYNGILITQQRVQQLSSQSYKIYLNDITDKSKKSVEIQKKTIQDLIKEWQLKSLALTNTRESAQAYALVQQQNIKASTEQVNQLQAEIDKHNELQTVLRNSKSAQATVDKFLENTTGSKEQEIFLNFKARQSAFKADPNLTPQRFQELDLGNLQLYEQQMREFAAQSTVPQTFKQMFDDVYAAINEGSEDALKKGIEGAEALLAGLDMTNRMASMFSATVDLLSMSREEMEAQTEGMNGAQKAAFFLTQTIAAASALINGIDLGMKMAAQFNNPALAAVGTALGAAQASAIMGVTIAGTFDKGGYIAGDKAGIVSEYGAELVNGALVLGAASVTSREETAKLLYGANESATNNNLISNNNVTQHINISGAGDQYLAEALRNAAKQGAEAGYRMVQSDFKTGRGIRANLKKSIGV